MTPKSLLNYHPSLIFKHMLYWILLYHKLYILMCCKFKFYRFKLLFYMVISAHYRAVRGAIFINKIKHLFNPDYFQVSRFADGLQTGCGGLCQVPCSGQIGVNNAR